MSDEKKTVLIIEDRKEQRDALVDTLNIYGFNAKGGATLSETLDLLRKHKNDVSVIIIDMYLESREFSAARNFSEKPEARITGIDLVKELFGEYFVQPPALLILSAYDKSEYYKKAIKAGASEYLLKGKPEDNRKIIPLTQALALKHSFQSSLLDDIEIARLVEGHVNSFEVINHFCSSKLVAELNLCFAASSYILLSRIEGELSNHSADNGKLAVYHDLVELSAEDKFDYLELHRQIFAQISQSSAYRFEDFDLPPETAGKLSEFVFVQLINTPNVKIAIGFIEPFPVNDDLTKYPYSTELLLEILVEKATPVLELFVEKLMSRWRETQKLKLEKIKTLADLSMSVQRNLTSILPERTPQTMAQASAYFNKLILFSKELTDYSQNLDSLLKINRSLAANYGNSKIRLSDIIREINAEYDRMGYFDDVFLEVERECLIPSNRNYFSMALRELVKWAVERKNDNEKKIIKISSEVVDNWVEIRLWENGEQLSKRFRENYLFEPISSVHMARVIIEIACRGQLIDATDELETAIGNLFKIKLLNT